MSLHKVGVPKGIADVIHYFLALGKPSVAVLSPMVSPPTGDCLAHDGGG